MTRANESGIPRYIAKPIESMAALSRALGVTSPQLLAVAARASSLYRVAEQVEKADGTLRQTFDAKPVLKDIHRRIKSAILDRVTFPQYLTGSIKGQDYRTNALLHRNSKILISEDIQGFFPSTGERLVYDVWFQFFGFSDDVSRCLTLLCVKDGVLPQGSIASAHLANLVFWRVEPSVQADLSRLGIRYSRYVDDICLSSPDAITQESKEKVIALVYAMLARHGYSAKRAKHKVQTSRGRIVATKLGVNREPSLSRQQRGQIRAAVHKVESLFSDGDMLQVRELLPSVGGRVSMLRRFHATEGAALAARLTMVREQLSLLPVPSATSAITSLTTHVVVSDTVPW